MRRSDVALLFSLAMMVSGVPFGIVAVTRVPLTLSWELIVFVICGIGGFIGADYTEKWYRRELLEDAKAKPE